jgi:hypothetical protein
MSTGRRQSIRQTEARGVVVRDSTPEEITQWFPGQLSALYEKHGRVLPDGGAVVRSMVQQLASHPRMLWRTACGEDGTTYGMTASIVAETRLCGWQMVGPPVHSMSPHTLLHWDSIKWVIAREIDYDMGGEPSKGIGVIKRSLGAETEAIVGAFQARPAVAYKTAVRFRTWKPVAKSWDLAHRLIDPDPLR